jgi:hypothetical protein
MVSLRGMTEKEFQGFLAHSIPRVRLRESHGWELDTSRILREITKRPR